MRGTQIRFPAGPLAAAGLMLLMGCEGSRGPQGPIAYSPVTISASIVVSWYPWETSSNAFVAVLNTPDLALVTINGLEIPRSPLSSGSYHWYDFPIEPGDSAFLVVNFTQFDGSPAEANAAIRMPGEFQILLPDTSQPLQLQYGDSLLAVWSAAEWAGAYRLQGNYGIHYYDTAGILIDYSWSLDTLMADTSLFLGSGRFFPADVELDSQMYGGGYFNLSAVQGPWQTGDSGNITGDGIGFFHGWTYGGTIGIDVVE